MAEEHSGPFSNQPSLERTREPIRADGNSRSVCVAICRAQVSRNRDATLVGRAAEPVDCSDVLPRPIGVGGVAGSGQ
jgi:hypothetical protein